MTNGYVAYARTHVLYYFQRRRSRGCSARALCTYILKCRNGPAVPRRFPPATPFSSQSRAVERNAHPVNLVVVAMTVTRYFTVDSVVRPVQPAPGPVVDHREHGPSAGHDQQSAAGLQLQPSTGLPPTPPPIQFRQPVRRPVSKPFIAMPPICRRTSIGRRRIGDIFLKIVM